MCQSSTDEARIRINNCLQKKMPTPPWYGHLLRGITEMSRKHRDRSAVGGKSSHSVVLTGFIACCMPNDVKGIE
jgi:hypothetical protein